MHNDDANKDGNIVSIGFKIQVGEIASYRLHWRQYY